MDIKEKRHCAYQFVCDKLQAAGFRLEDCSEPLPLSDLYLLKTGEADPSGELVAGLRRMLRSVATQTEFDQVLVEPFQNKPPSV